MSRRRSQLIHDLLPRGVIFPSALITVVFVYGFIAFTFYLSFTSSRILPVLDWKGFSNYVTLFSLPHWLTALKNLVIFSTLYIGICTALGLLLAILLDQKIAGERLFRPIYLYPMAISFIVTGTAWKWFLDPGIGIERVMQGWGFSSFQFDWIKNSDFAIYCVVLAAVWQATGFVMTMFLAGLRSINMATVEAARVDGASNMTLYTKVIIPQLQPFFLSVFVILGHLSIKSYDLVVALTSGGPGRATEMPSTFMYSYTFTRNQMSIGASSAVIMLIAIACLTIPYLRREGRGNRAA